MRKKQKLFAKDKIAENTPNLLQTDDQQRSNLYFKIKLKDTLYPLFLYIFVTIFL